jgi:hypothetical protein
MTSRVVDLTGDSSNIEPAKASMPRVKKAARIDTIKKAAAPPKPTVSNALRQVIKTVDADKLRRWVTFYCESLGPLREGLEMKLLVAGKEVVRYHEDSISEDDKDSKNESNSESGTEGEDESDTGEYPERRKKRKPITAADDELVPRFAKCLNCKEEFDVTCNDRGDCMWHPGICSKPWADNEFVADLLCA